MSQPQQKRNRSRKVPANAPTVVVQSAPAPLPANNGPLSRKQKKRSNRSRFRKATQAAARGDPKEMIRSLQSFASSGVNEEDFLLGVDFNSMPKHIQYAFCMLYPKQFQCRIPDGSNKRSALYTSIQVFDVPVVFTGAANDGSFAGAIQPILGNPSDPAQFKLALCKPDLLAVDSATTDWKNANSYASSIDGVDPRIDQNMDLLLFPNIGFFSASQGSGSSATKPFGTSLVLNAGNGFTKVAYDGTTTNGDFVLPNGEYIAVVQFLAAAGLTTITVGGSATNSILTTATSTATNVQQSFVITAAPGASNVTFASAGAAPTAAAVTFLPIARANQTGSYNNGLVQKLRPVAMSTLCTSMVPDLVNGGMIAGAVVPGDSLGDAFFSSNSEAPGPLRSYQTVAQVPGSYNGRFEKGLYMIWTTESPTDRTFKRPSDNNLYNYPTFVFAGNYTPTTPPTPTTTVPVLRVEIVQVHEYTTINQFPKSEICIGSQHQVDTALGLLAQVPKVMPNADHPAILKSIMSGIAKVANFAKNAIAKVKQYAPMIEKGVEFASGLAL